MFTDPPDDDRPLPSPPSILTDPPGPDDPDPLRIVTDPPDGPDPPCNTASPPRDITSEDDPDEDDMSPARRLTPPPTRDPTDVPTDTVIDPAESSELSPVDTTIEPVDEADDDDDDDDDDNNDDPVRIVIDPEPYIDDDAVSIDTPEPPNNDTLDPTLSETSADDCIVSP